MKKTLLLTFIWLFFALPSFPQSTGWQWARGATSKGTDNDVQFASGVATDNAGNVYALGFFICDSITLGTFTLYNPGGASSPIGFIAKYAPSGNVIWAINVNEYSYTLGGGITTDARCNVYITGSCSGNPAIYRSQAIVIAKYNSSGHQLWVNTMGGTSDVGNSIASDDSGNVFVTGNFTSDSIDFGGITVYNPGPLGNFCIFIAKYDAGGHVLWANSYSGPQASHAGAIAANIGNGISLDRNDNAYVTGYFSCNHLDFGNTTLYNADSVIGDSTFFIAKINVMGDAIWAKSAVSPDTTYGQGWSVATDNNANVYVTGDFAGPTITFDSITLTYTDYDPAANSLNYFIAKYDSAGRVLWAEEASGEAGSRGWNIATDAIGNVYVAGGFYSDSITFDSTTLVLPSFIIGTDPLFLVTYDPGGKVLCADALLSGSFHPGGLSVDRAANVYLVQEFNYPFLPYFILGADTLTNEDLSYNFYIAKYKCVNLIITADSFATICTGDTFSFYNKPYTATGIYVDTFSTSVAGDSVALLTLTAIPAATSNISQCILPGQNYLGYNATGIYYDTLHHSAANGCDSIVALNLTVKPLAVGNVQRQICPGDTFLGHTAAGTYTDTIHTATGCDSAVMLNLSYFLTATSHIMDTICTGQNYLGYDTTGIYMDTLQHASANGCDSIITLNLVVEPLAYGITKQRICLGDTFQGHTSAGTYYDTIHVQGGCDSLITLELQIDTLPAVIPIWQNGDTLYTLTGYKFYGWYQDSATLLTGGDSNTYIISHSGNYYVTISNDTQYCVKRSAEIAAYLTGIGSLAPGTQHLNIYPNPAQTTATIEWQPVNGTVQLSISDLVGREINTLKMDGTTGRTQIDISALADGIYLVKLLLPGGELMSGRLAVER